MPLKNKTIYICRKCGAQHPKWAGRCAECGTWSSLEEDNFLEKENKEKKVSYPPAKIFNLSTQKDSQLVRFSSGVQEFDRVLGGGIVTGSLVLFGGEPGIGKSTLMSQVALKLSSEAPIFYVSGEESETQVKYRLDRLGKSNLNFNFISETVIEKIISAFNTAKPKIVIIDSVQTISSLELEGEAGSLSQIRAVTLKLLEAAKNTGTAIFLVGHITKDGQLSGPKSLEHIVDTVVYLESDKKQDHCLLRAVKNRFGRGAEIGVLKMTESGFKDVLDGAWFFPENEESLLPGSVVGCALEGSRPFLVDIQSLVSKTIFGYPQRKASGYDANRLGVLATVLSKRQKINLATYDIILNIVGGFKVSDPALDLAVCAAVASSFFDLPVERKTVFIGEIGLSGEVRGVKNLAARVREAERLGFKKIYLPFSNDEKIKSTKLEIVKISSLSDFLNLFNK